jgi:hypothetical protein
MELKNSWRKYPQKENKVDTERTSEWRSQTNNKGVVIVVRCVVDHLANRHAATARNSPGKWSKQIRDGWEHASRKTSRAKSKRRAGHA